MNNTGGKRVAEWLKSIFIVILTASAIFLGQMTGLFNEFFGNVSFFGSNSGFVRSTGTAPTDTGTAHFKEAARPLTIVITTRNEERYGIKYDTTARNIIYDRTSSILGEALSSASSPIEINEEEWREALFYPGVYFEYIQPVKLSMLEGWLGVRLSTNIAETSLRRIFVAFTDDRSNVYYQDSDSGLFFCSETASAASKAQELDIYSDNGALFAFETSIDAAENSPYMLISRGNNHPDIRGVTSASIEELLELIQAVMEYGNETYIPYDNEGVFVRVGSQFNIRADEFGRVFYRRTDIAAPSGEEKVYGESAIIEKARAVVAETIGSYSSNAEVFFESMIYEAEDTASLYFSYFVAGGKIHLYEEGYAAKLVFVDGVIVEMELNFRSYTYNGDYTKLAPEKQILAAANAEFMLCYSDVGSERLQAAWVKYQKEKSH